MFGQASLSIRSKLFLGMMFPAAVLLLVAYSNYTHLSSLGRSAEKILAKNYRSIKAAYRIEHALRGRQNLILDALDGGPVDMGAAAAQGREIAAGISICQSNITEAGEAEIVARMVQTSRQYEALFQVLTAAAGPGRLELGEDYRRLLSVQSALGEELDRLIALNEQAMERAEEQTRSLASRAQRYSVLLLVAAVILLVLFGLIISNKISQPLIRLTRTVGRVKQGKEDRPAPEHSGGDEISFLTEEFNRLFARLQAYDRANLEELSAERAKAAAAEEAKARFIADLSHQLKTPMTSLSMSIGILAAKAKEGLDDRYASLFGTAEEDCARLTALINELVDLSGLDAVLKPLARERLDVADVTVKSLKPLEMQGQEKGVVLETIIDPQLPQVAIDSFRFPWVITNLVGNALRYTPPGGRIRLEIHRRGDRLVFRCSDTGRGIDPRFLPHIFDRFAQFSEREAMGTIGLGLAIVKDIIEQHGGDITVDSRLGQGTTFSFWIPAIEGSADEDRSGS